MTMKRFLVFAMMALLPIAIFAGKKEREVKKYDKHSPRLGAMVYALPRTHVQIEIKATCTISKPGPFAQYAERFLASYDAIMKESRVWSFQSADIIEKFIVDTAKIYAVTGETEEVEFVDGEEFLKSVGSWEENGHKHAKGHPFKLTNTGTADTTFHIELLGEEALTSTSIPKMAERAAKQIFMLREARMSILSCDVSHQPDGKATKEILKRIDSEEKELTALFMGKKATISKSRRFTVNPSEIKSNLIIARISTIEGITSPEDMIGTPVYVNTNPKIVTAPEETKKARKAHKGYFYNVPGAVRIVIRHGENYTSTHILDIPQNGYATWLAPTVRNILFNSNGTIRKMK